MVRRRLRCFDRGVKFKRQRLFCCAFPDVERQPPFHRPGQADRNDQLATQVVAIQSFHGGHVGTHVHLAAFKLRIDGCAVGDFEAQRQGDRLQYRQRLRREFKTDGAPSGCCMTGLSVEIADDIEGRRGRGL